MGVALGCSDPRMAKHLLNDADVHALFDQQRRGGMPSVMDPGIPNSGLPEDRLPGTPVLGTFDRTAMPRGEDQIMILLGVPRPQSLGRLPLAALLEELEDWGRALERELALALALPKDNTSTQALRAFVGVSNAICRTRTLVADVTVPRAVWLAGRKVPVLLAALLAGSPVPSLAARVRVATAVPPCSALNLEPCPYHTGSRSTYDQRRPSASPWRMPRASATDQRAPFLLLAATPRMRRASSRVRGSISCGATEGASTRVATFREIRPRRTAIVRARERMRPLRTVLDERPRRSMTV